MSNEFPAENADLIERQLELGEDDGIIELRKAWDKTLRSLSHKYPKATFENFLSPLQPLSFDGEIIVLGAPSSFAREWAEKKYSQTLGEQFRLNLGLATIQIRFVVSSKDMKPLLGEQPLPLQIAASPLAPPPEPPETSLVPSDGEGRHRASQSRNPFTRELAATHINERLTFADFLTGKSNRLAHAGAWAVAQEPGKKYNPLFLYGSPGLGKTHLMHAISNHVRAAFPKSTVAYVSGETFTNHYVASIREKRTEDFRRAYRNVDVLLVDDIQSIAGKEQTKEEFFHTFNTLHQMNKQIVIASDRSPRELHGMDERIRSRFESGLTADIGPPDLELRMSILQQKAKSEHIEIPDEVIIYMANLIQSNIRALEGALIKLMAYASVSQTAVTKQLAGDVLSSYFKERPMTRMIAEEAHSAGNEMMRAAYPIQGMSGPSHICRTSATVEQIVQVVAAHLGVEPEHILTGGARHKDIAFARQAAMYLSRDMAGIPTVTLAGIFGCKNHSAISHAHAKVRDAMETDSRVLSAISAIRQILVSTL